MRSPNSGRWVTLRAPFFSAGFWHGRFCKFVRMRVLIADDQPSVGHALALLVTAAKHQVVKIVNSGAEAIQAYRSLHPDVVLMDFSMSKLNGGTAARYILAEDPCARIVFVSGRFMPDLTGTGAMAILQKPVDLTELTNLLGKMDQQLLFDYSGTVAAS
jgi:two-component system chemotaxis response regulator CheY